MASNETILRKADLALSDLSTGGGLLLPEQSNQFIQKLLAQPTFLRQIRRVVMTAPQRKINKIGFGQRILHRAVSGVASTDAQRSKPTTESITLTTSEFMATVRLPYDVIEDNIMNGLPGFGGGSQMPLPPQSAFKDMLVTMIADRVALDLQELCLLGDTLSADNYLAAMDGFIKLANANVYDAKSAPVSRTLFKNGVKLLPEQYAFAQSQMKHFIARSNEVDLRDRTAERETPLGDQSQTNALPITVFGSVVEPVTYMPIHSGLFANPNNFIFGIQRDISIEVDKDITARVFTIVVTVRVCFDIEEKEAVVKYINIGAT